MNYSEILKNFGEGPDAIALGPSSLESIANNTIVLKETVTVVVPDNLMRLIYLIREESIEHRMFLIQIIRYFGARFGGYRGNDQPDDNSIVNNVVSVVTELEAHGRLRIIGADIDDSAIRDSLQRLYPGRSFEISLSPRRNFLRDYLVRIYSWSKQTGGVVIERTRRVFSDLGRHIASLQLPDRLDDCVKMKSKYIERVFDYRGGKAVKFFVGCAISVVGLTYYPAGLCGVVIAFADP